MTPQQAVALQRRLAGRIRAARPAGPLRYLAGVDAGPSPDGNFLIGAAVLWDRRTRTVVEEAVVRLPARFPYVPGLLSFRETPAVIAALRRLAEEPHAIICDAHGYAHPRRFGLACHVGLLCRRPTIGCAKSRLVGQAPAPAIRRGSYSELRDAGEIVGAVVRTQDGVRPVYVSVGHLIDLATARRIVLASAVRYRLPEPTRLADHLVRRAQREAGLLFPDRAGYL